MAHVAPTSSAPTLATPILHRASIGGGERERRVTKEGAGEFAVGKMKSECRNANAIAIVKVKLNALRQCLADCAAVRSLATFGWSFFLQCSFVLHFVFFLGIFFLFLVSSFLHIL